MHAGLSQHRAAFSLAYQEKSARGKLLFVSNVIPAATPFAVCHSISFILQLHWKIAALMGDC